MRISKLIRRKPIYFASLVMLTVVVLSGWFAYSTKIKQENQIKVKFNYDTSLMERSLVDVFNYTEFLMQMMNEKIKLDPYNNNNIKDVISNYRVNLKAANVVPWTYFDWINREAYIVVNAVYGVLDKPYDVSGRDYVKNTRALREQFVLSEPIKGKTSKRWIIVGAIGLNDEKGEYIGTNAIGFDLNTISSQMKALQKDENISFYIFDRSMNLLVDSSKSEQKPENIIPASVKIVVAEYMKKNRYKPIESINIFGSESNYMVKKLDNLPLYIYVQYDEYAMKSNYWQTVTSRVVELFAVGIVAILIVTFIYSRERSARYKAEASYKRALKAARGKSEFLEYTGHELRSPLNVIIFGSEMMKSKVFGEMPAKYVEYAEDIYQNGNDLLHFIEDLMDITKADAEGSFSLHPEHVNVEEIIDRVIKLNITRATKHKVKLEKLVSDNLPKLWADSRRLRQILNNLISNAIKYSPENTRVRILAHAIDGALQIIVEDEGFGMDSQQLDIALSRYGTVQNANSGKVESIGLGLPLVKQLVDAHKAKFDITSEPNKGTTVTLTFKLTEAPAKK